MRRKGQTALEYLLLVVTAIIIVVAVMVWMSARYKDNPCICPSPNQDIREFEGRLVERAEEGGCFGIFRYYTGTGYLNDISRMYMLTSDFWDPEYSNYVGRYTELMSPAQLSINTENFDCEDFVFFGYCLTKFYPGVQCMPYLQYTRNSSHVGMECVEGNNSITY